MWQEEQEVCTDLASELCDLKKGAWCPQTLLSSPANCG